MNLAGLYLHFPFCKSKCNYCDYYCLDNRELDIDLYIEMLLKEIRLVSIKENSRNLRNSHIFNKNLKP